MLYWYSGTGNSRHVARCLAEALCESDCRFIPRDMGVKTDVSLDLPLPSPKESCDDCVGFCFPVYSWGVPPIVLRLIETIESSVLEGKYVYSVLTCGDEAGLAGEMFRKALGRRGITLSAAFTIIMPNDYVLLPGFDIDSKQLEETKLHDSIPRMEHIIAAIRARKQVYEVHKGPKAWLKTTLVYPLFRKWGMQTKRWKVDTAKCISCGKCATHCPAGNITLVNSHPQWGRNCYSCTACFHICPVRAIDYGRFTKGKQQYYFPEKR